MATRTVENGATGMELVPVQHGQRLSLPEITNIGEVFARSGYFKDAADAAKAITKVLAGQELGIPPMQAMTGIHIVEGKPTLGAGLMAALIKGSGKYDYRVDALDEKECRISFYERGEPIGASAFTIADATRAGLAGRSNWKNYPRNMLFARALSNGASWYCPDVFKGPIYTPEELGAEVDGEGNVIRLPDIDASAKPAVVPQPEAASEEDVQRLTDLLLEEGHKQEAIDEVLAKRRDELGGVLTAEYVGREIAAAEERAAAVKPKRGKAKAEAEAEATQESFADRIPASVQQELGAQP